MFVKVTLQAEYLKSPSVYPAHLETKSRFLSSFLYYFLGLIIGVDSLPYVEIADFLGGYFGILLLM
jgi:hypothetical protein